MCTTTNPGPPKSGLVVEKRISSDFSSQGIGRPVVVNRWALLTTDLTVVYTYKRKCS